jgi:Cu+-exporting ATPase
MTWRFWVCLGLTLPVFILAMVKLVPPASAIWVQFALATPVALWGGWPFFQRFWASLVQRHPNMFTLIGLGTGTAYLYSLAATFFPGSFPAGFRGADGTVAVYYEAAAVITVLVLLGQMLELRARAATGGAIRALLNLAPKTARLARADGSDETIPLGEVRLGDRLRVRPGDAMPADGVVLEGDSAADESMLTGEAMPVPKAPGDAVTGGTINGNGALLIEARKIGAGSVLARIAAMVATAQRSRAPIQRIADTVSGFFVPAVLLVAIAAFAAWAIWGPPPSLAYALIAAVSVVIIACPCALGLATPMSIMVGTGKGAHLGVLFRSAEALERMEKIDTLVIDKTGTLTEGKPGVTAILPEAGLTEVELLRLAASLERQSAHPLASALLKAARARGIALAEPTGFHSETGKGVLGAVDGRAVALGNEALMAALGVRPSGQAASLRGNGATVLFASVDGAYAGMIAIADPVKQGAREALDRLRAEGIRIVMLTGDNIVTAQAVASTLGIESVEAELLPGDKTRIVAALRASGKVVAMAGDGVNDAPALAAADVGIAMGTGAEVAMQSAGVTLVKGDLAGIARARALSRATMRNIRQNLVFAFAYNAIGVPVAAGVLYPALGILLSPEAAALAMSLSSVSVIANALRLKAARV